MPDGHKERKSTTFTTDAIDLGTPFNCVSILTHGFQVAPDQIQPEDDPLVHVVHSFVPRWAS